MVKSGVIKVGSRGSALALIQDEVVIGCLKANNPDLDFEIDTVRTRGDVDQTSQLAGMGLGIFVKELEQELLDGKLDIAVHSLKDMPTQLAEGLVLGAVLSREDPRDVLVNRFGCTLEEIPGGSKIGTSSPRRVSQLKHNCPQVEVVPIRGNVETRLSKAQGGECDGAILAAAGLIRLGLTEHITEYLPPQQFVPPPGQGVLAVEMRDSQGFISHLLKTIEHSPTRQAITSERAFLETLGGGCQVPVGAYAYPEAETLILTVFIGSPDGKNVFRDTLHGSIHNPVELATNAYEALVQQGAGELLETARSE